MNDYVTAGDDYSDENMNSQDNNPAQASQEIAAGIGRSRDRSDLSIPAVQDHKRPAGP